MSEYVEGRGGLEKVLESGGLKRKSGNNCWHNGSEKKAEGRRMDGKFAKQC
jgi:hypothetical protein